MAEKGPVCVTGAAGFIGSWLIMRLLERGYTVRATVRDPNNMKKVKHLLDLPKASTNLTLWKADLVDEGSFDEPIKGCAGVFHVATPMDFESADPENEVIKPAIDGMLNILKSCAKAKTVKRIVFTSTAGTVCMSPEMKMEYDETSWTDADFCRTVKMNGWMYFVSKTLAEKTGWEFAEQNNLDLISIIPTIVHGPFLTPTLPPSMLMTFALMMKITSQYPILNPGQFVHVEDLCQAHIFLYEHPEAKGRYICSSHEKTITDLAKMLKEKYPEYDIPTEEFEGIQQVVPFTIKFLSKKLTDLGFEFKYSLDDMYDDAFRTCKEKGLPPAVMPPS